MQSFGVLALWLCCSLTKNILQPNNLALLTSFLFFLILHINPSSPVLPSSHSPYLPLTSFLSLLRGGIASHGDSIKSVPSLHLGLTKARPSVSRLSKVSLHRKWTPETSSTWTRDRSWTHCQWPHNLSNTPTVPSFKGSVSILCRFLSCQSRISELSIPRVSCFCGYPHHGLEPFAYRYSVSSTGLWEVGLIISCGYLHLLQSVTR